MKVGITSEASAFPLKEAIKERLADLGYDMVDVGAQSPDDKVSYFEAGERLAKLIQSGGCERGIAMCGTGGGISLIINKHKGCYCVACESVWTAERISHINNANVLAMGGKVVSHEMGGEMAEKFLAGKWCEGFAEPRRLSNEAGYQKLLELEAEE